uniref:Uncharacterized protein n=1 Tax=viral metagenome TaxID=1070528 RepID=A0A6M3JMV7_9ZZZZ
MADKKISELTEATVLQTEFQFPVVDTVNGETKHMTALGLFGAYFPNHDATDQGATGDSDTIKYAVDTIAANNGTIFLRHNSGSATTTYTLSTSEVIPANINLVIQKGAILSIDNAITLTIYSPANIKAAPNQQIFSGAGTIAFTEKNAPAYAEWWGIDGTSDEVQINLALTAAGIVELLAGKTYDAKASITMVTGGELYGHGDTTIIKDSRGTSTVTGIINVISKNNWSIHDFKMDGSSADSTVAATDRGIIVSGTSKNWTIKDIWLSDIRYIGLYVRGGENGIIDRIKITTGCLSNGILIGPYTGDADPAKNITVSNIIIEDINGDGVGIWDQNDTGLTSHITVSNLIVKDWGQLSATQAFWIHDAKYVTLNGFTFSDTLSIGGTKGNGLHFEGARKSTFSNGVITGANRGINFSDAVYIVGHASAGNGLVSSFLNFSNIVCDSNWIGLNGPMTYVGTDSLVGHNITYSGCIFSNNTNYGVIHGGKKIQFIGGRCNGTTDNKGYRITGNGASVATNIQILGTESEDDAGWFFKDCSNVIFKNNLYSGATIGTAVSWDAAEDMSTVYGETVTVRIRDSVIAGTIYEIPVYYPVVVKGSVVTQAYLSFSAAITQNDTDYNRYRLQVNTVTGAGGNVLSEKLTKLTGGSNFAARATINMAITPEALAQTSGLRLYKAIFGAGQAEADGLVTINYITY